MRTPPLDFLNHGSPILDAHNCYPYQCGWADRIDRARNSGFPVSIEQDLAWDRKIPNGSGRVVLSHPQHTTGSEPSLRDYFFERARPIVERSLAENDREHWPLIILHFDSKSGQAPLLDAVWKLLGEYETWITTAIKTADSSRLSPLEARPILAITEDSDDQEKVFFQQIPVGAKLRLFGSAHTKSIRGSLREQLHLVATLPPEKLLSAPPTNYRRWWNNSWFVVREGGQESEPLLLNALLAVRRVSIDGSARSR